MHSVRACSDGLADRRTALAVRKKYKSHYKGDLQFLMKKEKWNYFNKLIDNKQMNTELLISALANIQPRISNAAYMKAKFKNSGISSNEWYGYEMEFLMQYRSLITNVLLSKYSKSIIKEMVSSVDKQDIVSNRMTDTVIELIKSNKYQIC